MPPIRTVPAVRPVRTERTHEENQERAYIAASRRSDRSLEARVESARRASEIHKKRTGRSLRVREEDVMNEEMYEEEDDDLPMQYRRISALNPGLLPYTAFNERVNSYLAGQIGVRNYLHQAIFQANQNQYANQLLNPLLQHNRMQHGTMSPQALASPFSAQSPWSTSDMQGSRIAAHGRSASVATPQDLANYAGTGPRQPGGTGFDARRLSLSNVPSPRGSSSQPPTPHPLGPHNASPGPRPIATSPQAPGNHASAENLFSTGPRGHDEDLNAQAYPLTTKLPVEAQQLLDGTLGFANSMFASQMTPGIPMPSMVNYSYNPHSKKRSSTDDGAPTGLHQTLSPFKMHNARTLSSAQEPQSAMSAPGELDFGFNNHDLYGELGAFHDPNYNFGLNSGSGSNSGGPDDSGQATPNEGGWSDTDFFNYAAASD